MALSFDILLLLLLTGFKVHGQDPCVHDKGKSGPCLLAGHRSVNARIAQSYQFNKPEIPGQIVHDERTISLNDSKDFISYVEVSNDMPLRDWGTVMWSKGGIGERYITLHLLSQRSKAYSFKVKVYATPNITASS